MQCAKAQAQEVEGHAAENQKQTPNFQLVNKPPLYSITSLPSRCLLLTESERSISPKNFSKITRHNVKITYAIQQQLAGLFSSK